jgi:hypothetical protein
MGTCQIDSAVRFAARILRVKDLTSAGDVKTATLLMVSIRLKRILNPDGWRSAFQA